VILGIRPQDFEDAAAADPALPTIEVIPAVVEDLGSSRHVIFPIDAPPVDTDAVRATTDDNEDAVLLVEDRRAIFTAEVDESSAIRMGGQAPARLALNPSRFHFFDIESGETLRGRRLARATA
jgi:multiple sugar transport system ATP-binding protein